MTTTTNTTEPVNWTIAQKVAFRFFLIFFTLYIIFEPNGFFPMLDSVFALYLTPMQRFIPWLAKIVLGIKVVVSPTGSGDTTYDYCLYLLMVTLTVIGTLGWSAADRKPRNYNKLFYWLCVIVRYYLALTMVTYGGIKIIKLQFSAPLLGRLLEPLGNMSPMGLAWTYMGFSNGFNYFTGIAEMSVGLLLFFRKTTTLGAILGAVVAANIMAVNYFFDVPVKLLSTIMLLMCLFLLARDVPRMINFFLTNKTVPPANLSPHRFKARWKNITLITIKYVLIVYVLAMNLYGDLDAASQYGDNAKKPKFYGIYNVVSFVSNRDTVPPLTTDSTRWSKLLIPYTDGAQVRYMNDSSKYLSFVPDTVHHTFKVYTYADTLHKYVFNYRVKKDTLILSGKWKKDSLDIVLKRFDEKKFRLLSRGFHWINEQAYNR